MNKKWMQNGRALQKCIQKGHEMYLKWTRNVHKMEQKYTQNGPENLTKW